jgi:uracil-DNA glycosylase
MADEFDFSELRNYLSGQIDLGEAELLLDEPWTLTRKPAVPGAPAPAARPAAAPRPVPPAPTAARPVPRNLPPQFPNSTAPGTSNAPADIPQAPIPDTTGFAPSLFGAVNTKASAIPAANMPTARTVKRSAHAFESAETLDAFYDAIKSEAMYAKETALARYVGPAKPKLLFLLPAIKMAEAANISATSTDAFFGTAVGQMLSRLFASLSIDQKDIGITYFFKSTERALAPLLEAALRKMLTKELSFIQPEIMVTFGQPLFYQVFGKGKNFDDNAGTAMDFAGTKSVALVDPYAMVNDKQMKWLTWKVHIPRSGLFTVAAK